MPRPLKQLNPYASWTRLFGATLRQLRLKAPDGVSLTQADLGRLIAYSGATVSAVERGTLRPEKAFVEACERELNAGGVLRAFLPFVNAEWAEQNKGSGAPHQPHLLSPAEVASDPVALRTPTYLENLPEHTLEAKTLALRAGASDTSQGVVETVQLQVDRYCRDYPTVSPVLLEPRVRQRLRELHKLLDGRLTLRQRRELLTAGGFLTLLLSCLQFDMGHSEAAEESRDAAYQLGQAAEHQEIIAWTYEISAWFALVDRRYDDTVEHARAGLRVAPNTSAGVQLAVQEAKGWSRMGNAEEAERALQRGAIGLAHLPTHHIPSTTSSLTPPSSRSTRPPVGHGLRDLTGPESTPRLSSPNAWRSRAVSAGPSGSPRPGSISASWPSRGATSRRHATSASWHSARIAKPVVRSAEFTSWTKLSWRHFPTHPKPETSTINS